MTVELGKYGIWAPTPQVTPELARELEALGYGAIWLGGSPPADLAIAESLLTATQSIVVATGIVNMWGSTADEAAASTVRLQADHGERFLLGVGVGHPEAVKEYRKPYATMVEYLDELAAGGVPKEGMVLAALGPKALALSAEKTAGTHPYLTTPAHTREARAAVGPDAVVAPEQKVVLDTDPERARAIGRPKVAFPYLRLRNYTSNLLRLGYSEADIADDGSDRLIDDLVIHGDAQTVAAGLTAHLDAGASHVCAQVLVADDGDPLPAYRELAGALGLR